MKILQLVERKATSKKIKLYVQVMQSGFMASETVKQYKLLESHIWRGDYEAKDFENSFIDSVRCNGISLGVALLRDYNK